MNTLAEETILELTVNEVFDKKKFVPRSIYFFFKSRPLFHREEKKNHFTCKNGKIDPPSISIPLKRYTRKKI